MPGRSRERNGYDRDRDRNGFDRDRDRRRRSSGDRGRRGGSRDRSRDRRGGGGGGFGGGRFGRGRDRDRFNDRGRERRDHSDDITENMEIESDKVKYVIGRGGTKIRDIQYSCRVSVQIDKSPNDSGFNNVVISGSSASNIKRAKDAINEVVRRVLEFEDTDRDRSRDREPRRRKYSDSD